jgi:hypothetical protein
MTPCVPLVVGVSGHRDLVPDEIPLLEGAVADFFADLRARFPDLPLRLITPLAEGADRLVARVAMAAGIPLTLLLPMPAEFYRMDFDAESDAVFEAMRAGSECVELPLLDGGCADSVSGPGPARDRQYEYLGIYLAAHSHILLALWDGRESRAPGGTAQVVHIHQQDRVELLGGDGRSPIDFSEDESDLVYHIACSRREAGRPAAGLRPGDSAWLTRDDLAPRTSRLPVRYAAVFGRQAAFNRDLESLGPAFGGGDRLAPPDADVDSLLRDIESLYACADALAVRFQRVAVRALGTLFSFILLTGVCFILYADFSGLDLMIYGYLLSLIVVLTVYGLERRAQWYRRYLDYRALAEGLRVQFYWALAGVTGPTPARFAHDGFLRRQDLELGWIRNLMRFAGRRTDARAGTASPTDIERAIAEWIDDHQGGGQLSYYRRALARSASRSRFTARLANVCFAAGVFIAMILALWGTDLENTPGNLLIALMGGLPFAAAVRQSYAFRTSERELVAQYAHMARLFSNAQRLLATETATAARRDILRALGEAALDENGLWLMRQRERPLSSGQLFPA